MSDRAVTDCYTHDVLDDDDGGWRFVEYFKALTELANSKRERDLVSDVLDWDDEHDPMSTEPIFDALEFLQFAFSLPNLGFSASSSIFLPNSIRSNSVWTMTRR